MILHHGSTKDFDKFEISEKHLSTKIENLIEGMGIYFSDNKEFVKSYGNFIYTIDMDNNDCWDFTNPETMPMFIDKISEKVKFPILNFLSPNSFEWILNGNLSIRRFSREIMLQLDSVETFYEVLGNRDSEELFEEITKEYEKLLFSKRFFKYFDASFKTVIYLCTNKEDTVKILSKERVEC